MATKEPNKVKTTLFEENRVINSDEGTHQGTLYFAYFSKDIGQRVYLALKRQKNSPLLKPHIFYSEDGFKIRKGKIIKGTPTL